METKPLLSDEVKNSQCPYKHDQVADAWKWGVDFARDIYETARAEDARLIQTLVDALEGACAYARTYDECPYLDGEKALSAAAARDFKPTEQP